MLSLAEASKYSRPFFSAKVRASSALTLRLITPLVPAVDLVAHQHHHDVRAGVEGDLLHPAVDIVKAFPAGHVENDERPDRTA